MIGDSVVCAVVAAVTILTLAHGGPARAIDELKDSFHTLPAGGTPVQTILIADSSRSTAPDEHIWPVALDEFRESPLVGIGAGSFEYWWYEKRPSTRIVRDAHSVYLESLAELGLLGLDSAPQRSPYR